ncbi:2OG-Fe(II) oxygenase family protein [bacterium]|jgi:hypothetical protein|nr:2OG-Fe(II) oxygenase family protein [bacterium]
MEIKLVKPFGPSICKAEIPKKILDELNNHIDDIVLNEKKANFDFGKKLVGDVTQEFSLEKEFVKKCGWLDFLGQCVYEWIRLDTGEKITKFNLTNSWIVRQFENEYNPVHWHSGHISGAGFLKVPDTLGTFKQDKGEQVYNGGNLNLIHGSQQFLSRSVFKIFPKVGDFYFFPNYLMHTVYPFKDSKEERRSISFNAVVDDKVYNAYDRK